jgi:hypothetical protein
MKLTDAKLNANKENAQHSTGPRTPEGKARASLNATRHGLTGQTVVMPGENLEIYGSFCLAYFKEWQPQGQTEKQVLQTLADTQWRIHRANAFELAVYANGHEKLGDKIQVEHPEVHAALTAGLLEIEQSKVFDRISRHTSRLKREFRGTLQELQSLQAQRRQREQQELDDAALLRQVHEMKQTTFTPAAYGFVLHTAQIDTYIRRNHDLEDARIAQRFGFNLKKYQAATANGGLAAV